MAAQNPRHESPPVSRASLVTSITIMCKENGLTCVRRYATPLTCCCLTATLDWGPPENVSWTVVTQARPPPCDFSQKFGAHMDIPGRFRAVCEFCRNPDNPIDTRMEGSMQFTSGWCMVRNDG